MNSKLMNSMKPRSPALSALPLPAISEGLWKYVRAAIGQAVARSLNNDFVVAGISTSLITGIVYLMRYLLKNAKERAQESMMRLYVTVDVEHSGLYRSMAQWLNDSGALDASACYKALPKSSGTSDAEAFRGGKGGGGKGRGSQLVSAKSYSLTPADVDVCFLPMGCQETYRITFEGRPVWVTLTAESEISPKMRRRPGLDSDRIRIQALNFGCNGRDLIRRLLVAVQTAAMRASENKLDLWHCVRTRQDVEWDLAATISKRPASTVVLDEGVMEDILSDVTKFINHEAWYAARNIPHRRGYLLEGPPGCGKTSLIRAVASEFSLPLCCVQLKGSRVGEAGIEVLLQKAPEGAIIFIEDIDCAEQAGVSSREGPVSKEGTGGTDTERVTMSELLNAIDGLGAQTGRLLFLTTNHPERLDEALIRDGRIDRRFHVGLATRHMTKRIFLSICADDTPCIAREAQAEQFAQVLPEGLSMAEIQGFLVKHHEKSFDEIVALARCVSTSRLENIPKAIQGRAEDQIECKGEDLKEANHIEDVEEVAGNEVTSKGKRGNGNRITKGNGKGTLIEGLYAVQEPCSLQNSPNLAGAFSN